LLNSLKNIFKQSESETQENDSKKQLSLLCGLMLEAAQVDGKIDQIEIDKISKTLTENFQENQSAVELELINSLKEIDEPKSLHSFTSKLNKEFSNKKKDLLIETLWEIILSDGKIHEFESNLIRRLAGLLYISDVSCGNAKKRAQINLMNHKN
jgi:uncharacterized tellurite resistance protein B-like protein|tara:strand:+ start:1005 stop:1466 length:462 start_codon:yes stop_codon:yes gene_type:complete